MMASDEDKVFLDEMSDVVPLKRAPRVSMRGKQHSDRDSSLDHRRQAAVQGKQVDRNTLTEDGIEPLDAWFVLEFKRPGVQNGVFRKLKQGRYEAEARLNLHRMGMERARGEVFEFIMQCEKYGMRSVMIIHGKGENARERQNNSLLKGCVNHWLQQIEQVQAFHSAKPQHGGTGAVYLLLRKSEEQKQKNRERFRDRT